MATDVSVPAGSTRPAAGPAPSRLRLVGTRGGRIGVVLFVILVVAIPVNTTSTYWLGILNAAGIAAIAAIGLNVLTGYAGQLSLGQAFFVGVGAFVTQYVGGIHGLPMIVWLPAAGIVAGLAGAAVAPFALRLRGPYLMIVSLAWCTSASTSGATCRRSPAATRAPSSRRGRPWVPSTSSRSRWARWSSP